MFRFILINSQCHTALQPQCLLVPPWLKRLPVFSSAGLCVPQCKCSFVEHLQDATSVCIIHHLKWGRGRRGEWRCTVWWGVWPWALMSYRGWEACESWSRCRYLMSCFAPPPHPRPLRTDGTGRSRFRAGSQANAGLRDGDESHPMWVCHSSRWLSHAVRCKKKEKDPHLWKVARGKHDSFCVKSAYDVTVLLQKKQWIKCVRERSAKHSQQTLINNLSDGQKAVAAVLGSTSLHAGLLEMMLKLCNRYPRILLLATTNWSKFISITPLTQLVFNLGG